MVGLLMLYFTECRPIGSYMQICAVADFMNQSQYDVHLTQVGGPVNFRGGVDCFTPPAPVLSWSML